MAVPAVVEKNVTVRQEFGAVQHQNSAETAIAAVAARERAKIEAMYVMAERHPRNWDNVRVRLLQHCERPGFATIARYKKPAGRKMINGEWVNTYAEGLSARFAEIARQEAGNLCMESSVVYEDDVIRIVRASVVDLERNNLDSREVTIAKVVEKKGKQNKKTQEWEPPEGRDIIGNPRLNTAGEPVWLCKATDDEIRNKQNAEISKSQRDESLRLIPKDIRDDCEARILAVVSDPKKVDPTLERKKVIDSFARLNVMPDDLVTYIGTQLDRISPAQLDDLRGLWAAINDGEIDFQTALRMKYDQPAGSPAEQDAAAEKKIAELEEERKRREAAQQQQTTSTATPQQATPATEKAAPAVSATKADAPSTPVEEKPILTHPVGPSQERKTYSDRDELPDAEEVPEGTECNYMGKVLRSISEGGKPRTWKTVEEPVTKPKATPSSTERPQFGRPRP